MKIYKIFVCFLILLICCDVEAIEYKVMDLIPIETMSSVSTETFNYIDFVYHSSIDGDGNSSISFSTIKNNTDSTIPVSVNILLFDAYKKNIGFLSYCSDRDISSDNSGFQLEGNAKTSFSILVNRKYFPNNKKASDVKYISVLDDNRFCQADNFGKYYGMTIDQIKRGELPSSGFRLPVQLQAFEEYLNSGLITICLIVIGVIILYYAVGTGLNALNKKIYNKTTTLAYLPITNTYVAIKLSFGKFFAIVYVTLYCVSIFLYFLGVSDYFFAANIIFLLSVIVDMFKLFTKKFNTLKIKSPKKVLNESMKDIDNLKKNDNTYDEVYLDDVNVPNNNQTDVNNIIFDNDKFISSNVDNSNSFTNNTDNSIDNNFSNVEVINVKGDGTSESEDLLADLSDSIDNKNIDNAIKDNDKKLDDSFIKDNYGLSDLEINYNYNNDLNLDDNEDEDRENNPLDDEYDTSTDDEDDDGFDF